ncbi:HNH endonuclease signature motif containing protein [Nocardioides piscis]|uniref:DUF222 domain-containing protein n=1 Tax=Nocardioides piscis TaxID=2714938 RepID=A0A6G7YG91_9ACTN|nr:HNH endonuclease signature motif containing protein [Nocardioides piscis]QIK75825.1 DUF222 domain-containing protein [Nocardioides piscis]
MVHPILAAADSMGEALKSVADANPIFMTTDEKATALTEVARLEARVGELKLRLLAAADDVAAESADRSRGAWLARRTLCRREEGRADERLAEALDRRWLMLALAVREGRVNLAQARTIVTCLDALDDKPVAGVVTPETVAAAEQHLVAQAEVFGPEELGRLGRRILEVVAPEVAEEAEARRLADLESEAQRRTRLQMRRLGDGTTRLSARLPDAAASRLATCLEAFANPRKQPDGETRPDQTDPVARLPYPRRLGQAFCHLLEAIDPTRLPVHGGDATTVFVTIPLESLRADLGVAALLDGRGSVPGDDATAGGLSAAEARRLACAAKIIPVVLGGASEVLDLGRARRLFTAAQRKALLLRDRTCRAAGCDIPGTWAEAHHWTPWSAGGATDLENGVLLCSHHHHRVHDPAWVTQRMPDGDVRFSRRT